MPLLIYIDKIGEKGDERKTLDGARSRGRVGSLSVAAILTLRRFATVALNLPAFPFDLRIADFFAHLFLQFLSRHSEFAFPTEAAPSVIADREKDERGAKLERESNEKLEKKRRDSRDRSGADVRQRLAVAPKRPTDERDDANDFNDSEDYLDERLPGKKALETFDRVQTVKIGGEFVRKEEKTALQKVRRDGAKNDDGAENCKLA